MVGILLRQGLRVVITAGASGIGRAAADLLIANGARVHICDVAEQHLEDFRKAHPNHGASHCDVADEEQVRAFFAEVKGKFGGLDSLINNAGIAGPTGGVEEINPAEWRRTLEVCLFGQFLCAHFAVPMLKQSDDATIVNLSSAAGRYGYAYRTPYSAAKWGVIGFTQSLAKELGPAGVRVNAILPGIIKGPRIESVIRARAEQVGVSYEAMEQEYVNRISLRRMTPPEDVASMILFLLSPAGANISGQSLGVDGNVESL